MGQRNQWCISFNVFLVKCFGVRGRTFELIQMHEKGKASGHAATMFVIEFKKLCASHNFRLMSASVIDISL